MNDREAFRKLRNKVIEEEDAGVSQTLTSSTIKRREVAVPSNKVEDASCMEREMVDLKIMKCLCANGLSFNLLRSPYFHDMVSAICRAPMGYKAPSSEKARTALLDETKRSVERELTPLQDTWYTQGVSVVSDGWSNVKHDPLINVLAVNSRGAMFMHSADFSGVEKSAEMISAFLLRAIEEIGPSNVIQIVTDNASNCVAAGREIQKVRPHIFWSPCVVHTLNLVFKDSAKKFAWMEKTYAHGKQIVNFFLAHQQTAAMFKSHSTKVLLQVAKTRFASIYITLKRLLDVRDALATTVVTSAWRTWLGKQDVPTRKSGETMVGIITDGLFWEEVNNIVSITKPIWRLLKFCDGEGPKVGETYERMDSLVGEIKDVMVGKNMHKDDYKAMEEILVTRWDKMNIPLHCLGYALSPRFYDPIYLETKAPGGFRRCAPNLDVEVVRGCMDAYKRVAEDESEEKLLRDHFVDFQMRKGIFSTPQAQSDAVTLDAIEWWTLYGSQTPELAEVAKKILSQPVSSSSAERVWSTYGFIHNLKRNRLSNPRADKLVYIHCNLRLISRLTQSYVTGPFRKWDVNPEDQCLELSTAEVEDMRWKYLDTDFVDEAEGGSRKNVKK